jgi:hypothetical protein
MINIFFSIEWKKNGAACNNFFCLCRKRYENKKKFLRQRTIRTHAKVEKFFKEETKRNIEKEKFSLWKE